MKYLLKDKLQPNHFEALQKVFPSLNLNETVLKYAPKDGKLGTIAFVKGTVFGYPNEIWLDNEDWSEGLIINPYNGQEGLVICHELIHLEQASRGFWTRVRMWWARRTQPYPKPPSYDVGSWHEVEAHLKDEIMLAKWKCFIKA